MSRTHPKLLQLARYAVGTSGFFRLGRAYDLLEGPARLGGRWWWVGCIWSLSMLDTCLPLKCTGDALVAEGWTLRAAIILTKMQLQYVPNELTG